MSQHRLRSLLLRSLELIGHQHCLDLPSLSFALDDSFIRKNGNACILPNPVRLPRLSSSLLRSTRLLPLPNGHEPHDHDARSSSNRARTHGSPSSRHAPEHRQRQPSRNAFTPYGRGFRSITLPPRGGRQLAFRPSPRTPTGQRHVTDDDANSHDLADRTPRTRSIRIPTTSNHACSASPSSSAPPAAAGTATDASAPHHAHSAASRTASSSSLASTPGPVCKPPRDGRGRFRFDTRIAYQEAVEFFGPDRSSCWA